MSTFNLRRGFSKAPWQLLLELNCQFCRKRAEANVAITPAEHTCLGRSTCIDNTPRGISTWLDTTDLHFPP